MTLALATHYTCNGWLPNLELFNELHPFCEFYMNSSNLTKYKMCIQFAWVFLVIFPSMIIVGTSFFVVFLYILYVNFKIKFCYIFLFVFTNTSYRVSIVNVNDSALSQLTISSPLLCLSILINLPLTLTSSYRQNIGMVAYIFYY